MRLLGGLKKWLCVIRFPCREQDMRSFRERMIFEDEIKNTKFHYLVDIKKIVFVGVVNSF